MVVAVYAPDGRLQAATFGATTVDGTLLFSNPHALLTSPQMLRIDSPDEEGDVAREILGDAAGEAGSLEDVRAAYGADVGAAVVIRSLEDSRLLVDGGLAPAERTAVVDALLAGVKSAAHAAGCGSVAFPYVRAGDRWLREALRRNGFLSGLLCGSTRVELDAVAEWDQFMERLRPRRRRKVRHELAALERSGLVLREFDLRAHLGDVARLERLSRRRHGADASEALIAEAKREFSAHLGDRLRAVGCFDGDRLMASVVGLVGDRSYWAISYGADDSVPREANVYPSLVTYDPVRYATAHGLGDVRLLFEAYEGKVIRGGSLDYLLAHVWVRASSGHQLARRLLHVLDRRNRRYFSALASRLGAAPFEGSA